MIEILKGSRFAVISHRIQQLIPFLIWGFGIFSNSRTIMRSKSTKWKAYSNNQTIAYKKKRGCWFTHFTTTTVSATNSGRVWFRLSFERRNHCGGVADRRAKQWVTTVKNENDFFWKKNENDLFEGESKEWANVVQEYNIKKLSNLDSNV